MTDFMLIKLVETIDVWMFTK